MTERALSFGPVAARYERFRPGYPDALARAVLDYAGRPVRTALEIGAGTGKATRLFAAHGVPVTATEPDPEMLAELGRHVPDSVTTRRARFEELPVDGPQYDMVFAAAALHWTAPQQRWSRIAALLAPGGTFANFGGAVELADPELEAAVRAAHAPWIADDHAPSPAAEPDRAEWPASELRRTPWFTDIRRSTLERRWSMPAADFVGYLSTVSAYLVLDEADRQAAFAAITDVLPDRVEVAADIHLDLARRGEP